MLAEWLISSCKISGPSLFHFRPSLSRPSLSLQEPFLFPHCNLPNSPPLWSPYLLLTCNLRPPPRSTPTHLCLCPNRRQPEVPTPFLHRSIFPLLKAAAISNHLSASFPYPLLTPRPSLATSLYFSALPCCSLSLESQQQSLPLYFHLSRIAPFSLLLLISLALQPIYKHPSPSSLNFPRSPAHLQAPLYNLPLSLSLSLKSPQTKPLQDRRSF
ncbi:hypothetical protein AMTRI_Chr07g75650 [Amborella trichopoda]